MFLYNTAVEEAMCELEYLTRGHLDWTFADASFQDDDDPIEKAVIGTSLAGKADGKDVISVLTPAGRSFFFLCSEEEALARIAKARAKYESARKSASKSRIPLRRK